MNKFLLILICSICICCKNKEGNSNKDAPNKEDIRDLKISKKANEKGAKFCWDTLNYMYSTLYDPVLNSKIQLIKEPEIIDISKKDSIFNIRLYCGFYPTYYFNLQTSDEVIVNKLIAETEDAYYPSTFLLFVSIDDIEKGIFEINAYSGFDGLNIELEASEDVFFGNGQLKQIEIIEQI